MKSPQAIIDLMLKNDAFSDWLGVNIIEVKPGSCVLNCPINGSMLNGFNIAHGGITYSLSDSALAFAANAYGFKCVSIETSIYHLRKVVLGDNLTVNCFEINRGKSTGTYSVEITNQNHELISKFKGTVHISKDIW